jgi:hypothetical protein
MQRQASPLWFDSIRCALLLIGNVRKASLSAVACALSATASAGSNTVVLGPPSTLVSIPRAGYNLTVADVNSDGKPDLILGGGDTPPAIYLSNGGASPFAGVSPISLPFSYQQRAYVADLNGDGHPDIVAIGFGYPTVIYFNNGSAGAFNGVLPVAIGPSDPAQAGALGDVNGDGFPDLGIANTNHVPSRLYLSQGAPLSAASTPVNIGTDVGFATDIQFADVNGDGRLDAIVSYFVGPGISSGDAIGIYIYLNSGGANPFASVVPIKLLAGHSVERITIGDVNGDGKPDLIVAEDTLSGSGGVTLLLNTGSPTSPYLTAEGLMPDSNSGLWCYDAIIADVNGDGLPDLTVACQPPVLFPNPLPPAAAWGGIYLNNGTSDPFVAVKPIDMSLLNDPNGWGSVAIGDVTATGRPTLLVANANSIFSRPFVRDGGSSGGGGGIDLLSLVALAAAIGFTKRNDRH